VRVVLDANVLISATLSPNGKPAELLRAWQRGDFELIVSRALLQELATAFAYPKLRRRVRRERANALISLFEESATVALDPGSLPGIRARDPDDDYLLVLAEQEGAALVSGDEHLLKLAPAVPVYSPASFLELLQG
jgi:putative PIN family toxin of toxin-antitoxin system